MEWVMKLSGAVYRVTAESAIYTPDGALMYQKGDVVADGLTTGDSGEVMLNNVPLGSYVVEETQAPAGFVLSGEKHTVKLEYAGQDAEVAFNETAFTNERQKAAAETEVGNDIVAVHCDDNSWSFRKPLTISSKESFLEDLESAINELKQAIVHVGNEPEGEPRIELQRQLFTWEVLDAVVKYKKLPM